MKLKRERYKREGRCISCGAHPVPDRAQCSICLNKCSKKYLSLREKRVRNGKCYQCKDPAEVGIMCYRHWFSRNIAAIRLGSKTLGPSVMELFEAQGKTCPYTGRKLVPGVNANLDHKMPVSRGGKHELDNLQWVDSQINRMKTDMTHEEFLNTCRSIALRFPVEQAGIEPASTRSVT